MFGITHTGVLEENIMLTYDIFISGIVIEEKVSSLLYVEEK